MSSFRYYISICSISDAMSSDWDYEHIGVSLVAFLILWVVTNTIFACLKKKK